MEGKTNFYSRKFFVEEMIGDVKQMPFLSAMVDNMPAVQDESQSDFSFDDLDISDDSVLDEMYSGLPPW